MLARALIAAALLVFPAMASAATPRHHHAARVTTATYRTPMAHRAAPDLRASAHGREHAVRTRYAAGRHHPLTRGS